MKSINKTKFEVKIIEVNEEIKYYNYIQTTDFLLLNFDLLNRESYENIDSQWKTYLMDKVGYSNRIYLLGNYIEKGHHLTTRQEIEDFINSDENIKIEYFEIGGFSDKELVDFFDDRIIKAVSERLKCAPSKNNDGSCIIY